MHSGKQRGEVNWPIWTRLAGRATPLALGGSHRADYLLRDSAGTRFCRGVFDPGSGIRGLVDPRWLADLLQISKGGAPELRGASDPPLPGFNLGVDACDGAVSAGS